MIYRHAHQQTACVLVVLVHWQGHWEKSVGCNPSVTMPSRSKCNVLALHHTSGLNHDLLMEPHFVTLPRSHFMTSTLPHPHRLSDYDRVLTLSVTADWGEDAIVRACPCWFVINRLYSCRCIYTLSSIKYRDVFFFLTFLSDLHFPLAYSVKWLH